MIGALKEGELNTPKTCTACNGSGYYDAKDNPPCDACEGTGKASVFIIKSEVEVTKDDLEFIKPNVCGSEFAWKNCRLALNTYPGCSAAKVTYDVCPYRSKQL